MVRTGPKADYELVREAFEEAHDDGEVPTEDFERVTTFVDAYDDDKLTVKTPEGESGLAYGTLKGHLSRLKVATERMDGKLVEATADDINEYLDALLSGDHADIKDDGFTPDTVKNHAGSIRRFYEYHDDLGVEKADIAMPSGEDTSPTEDEMFTKEEVQALRDAAPNMRDKCLLDLLIYTGQRVRAIQTLRIKDVNPDDGTFTLNDSVDGLKGATGKRPLLGAVASLKKWLEVHPCPDDPEAHVITNLHTNNEGVEAGDPLHSAQIHSRLKQIGEEAGVEKPVNPHNFRHYFVTVAKRDYGLEDSEIKHLIGHRPDSTVMETTYSHLTDEDVIENVEVAAGFREPDDESPLSPPVCPTCDEPLPDNARACSMCGTTFTPDAKAAQDTIEDLSMEGAFAADDADEQAAVEALSDHLKQMLQDNPEMATELLRDAGVLNEE